MKTIAKKHKINLIGDSSSSILIPEFSHKINFNVKNFFIISANKNKVRGNHAHKKSRQILILVNGKVQIELENRNKKQKIIYSNSKYFFDIPKMTWLKLTFLEKSCLFCLSTEKFIENEYIREYSVFKKLSL